MSDRKERLPLAEARAVAEELSALLRPALARCVVAGSIRRERPDVGDIEIVCEPVMRVEFNLWGEPVGRGISALEERCGELLRAETVVLRRDGGGRAANGERYKRLAFRGVGVDVFSVVPGTGVQWGLILALRTGPAEFSRRLVTSRTQGGLLPPYVAVRQGGMYHVGTGDLWPTPEEPDVFAVLGVRWIPPEMRDGWEVLVGQAEKAAGAVW